jgi:ATPase subunit of ABC transporter with duplicated ATPase domains
MDIKHARRILIVGAPGCGSLEITKALTGSSPAPHASGSCAGLTHEWDVRTAYYNAKVPLWIDEISDVQEWKEEFMKEEAGEVVQAVGAWVYAGSSAGSH